MTPVEDFHLGADVYSSDGKHVGSLKRLVVDREKLEVHELVVQESRRFSGHLLAPGSAVLVDELVVPIATVASASAERIDLAATAAQARQLRPYLTYKNQPLDSADISRMASTLLGGYAYIPRVEEESAEAPGELEIEAGENVMLGHDGKKLGEVKDVLVEDGELAGVVVHRGLFEKEVILPRRFLERSDNLALFAHLSEEDLEHLEPFEPTG